MLFYFSETQAVWCTAKPKEDAKVRSGVIRNMFNDFFITRATCQTRTDSGANLELVAVCRCSDKLLMM